MATGITDGKKLGNFHWYQCLNAPNKTIEPLKRYVRDINVIPEYRKL